MFGKNERYNGCIGKEFIPLPNPGAPGRRWDGFNEQVSLEELEKRYIRYVYFKTSRNKVKTAEILGIDRKTLYSKLAKYGTEEAE